MLIVNADDLGYNASTNAAIVRGFELQLCSSTTILTNLEGFDEACELVHEKGLVEHVGLHLNLSEGTPLTEPIRRSPRFCDREGRFRLLRNERIIRLEASDRRLLADEVRAQIARLRARRIPITHIDSHKNIHEEWGIFTTLLPLVREAGIAYVRPLRNIGRRTSFTKDGYRTLINLWLRRHNLVRTRYFGSITDYDEEYRRNRSQRIDHSCEIMVHPCLGPDAEILDLCTQSPLAPMASALRYARLAVSYTGHRYAAQPRAGAAEPPPRRNGAQVLST